MFGAPVTITPPIGELISIESARSFLRVDGEALDMEIALLAGAAVQDVEDATGLRLLNQTVRVTADSFADLALLRVGPVRSVASIGYRDAAGDDQLVAGAAYELAGAVFEQGISAVDDWPAAQAGSITVTLEVGYGEDSEDVPEKLRYAVFALLRGKFENVAINIDPLITNSRFWLA